MRRRQSSNKPLEPFGNKEVLPLVQLFYDQNNREDKNDK
jgi:hypothetical protein